MKSMACMTEGCSNDMPKEKTPMPMSIPGTPKHPIDKPSNGWKK